MKNLSCTAMFLFLTFWADAQNNGEGIAVYESKTDISHFNIEMPEATEEVKKGVMEKMAKSFEKTYVLKFNRFESIYEEEQKLQMQGNLRVISNKTDGKIYKNNKDQIEIMEQDLFDKEFLIVDKLKIWNWELVNETKTIGTFKCQKAIVIIPVSEEELMAYEKDKKEQENAKTAFYKVIKPTDKIITAWYTPEIAIASGPSTYWGLPGLILEVNDGKTILLCSKISLNPKEKIKIVAPKKGKKVTYKEFEKIENDKMNSLKDENGVIQIDARK